MVETVPTIHEKQKDTVDIPKSREIYSGDINDAVIAVQKITSFEITPDWWFANVGNEGTTEEILDKFDTAFAEFVINQGSNGSLNSENQTSEQVQTQIIKEAEEELKNFDEQTGGEAEAEPLRSEFIDVLTDHLKEKYFLEDDTQKLEFEHVRYNQIFEKFPESEHNMAFSEAGIDVISCGRELSDHEAAVIRSAITKISDKIGTSETERLLGGTKLFAGENLIDGGGLALPRFNAVVIDLEKIDVTISQMEDMLSATGDYRVGDQSRLVDSPEIYEASELGIVHELGHILEYKIYGDVDKGFTKLDQSDAPTEYGSKSAREDYAESFMYYIYGGNLDSVRLGIVESDIMVRR